MLWDFNKKKERKNIIKQWHMTFQALDLKRKQFLNLLNNDLTNIELSYTKGGPMDQTLWLFQFVMC